MGYQLDGAAAHSQQSLYPPRWDPAGGARGRAAGMAINYLQCV